MRLSRSDQCFFDLKLRGYQFPDIVDKQYDSDWLMVEINVRHPFGEWSAVDPSLLTSEIESLIHWFEKIDTGDYSKAHLWFIEPCLEFHVIESEEHPNSIKVVFSHEYRPPWGSKEFVEKEEHHLEFPLTDVDLKEVIASLQEELARFPTRVGL